jgi:ATP-dependent protease ClpP protease subunit/outer membrane murein-binding lipoprotein Lpp
MEATIRLYDEIDKGAAKFLGWQLDDLSRYPMSDGCMCESVDIRINSIGGYMTEGLGIYGAIIGSEVPCDTYIDGVAMSMGMTIAQAGRKRYMASHAIAMIHPVQPGEDGPDAFTEKSTQSTIDILAKRAKCSREEIQAMTEATTFLDAQECLKLGLIDEIFDLFTEAAEVEMPGEEMDMSERYKAIAMATNKFMSASNKSSSSNGGDPKSVTNPLTINMETVAKAKFDELATNYADLKSKAEGLEEVANKVKDLEAKAFGLEATNKALTEQVTAFKAERATNLVNDAEAAGKFKSDAKNAWLEKATADFEGTKALLDSIGANVQAPKFTQSNKVEGTYTAAGVMAEIQSRTNK